MKWSRFHTPQNRTTFIPGDWNLLDDISGKKVKASTTEKQWDGYRTQIPLIRNEQDFLRSHPERIRTPFARPEPADVFVNTTTNMQSWQPNTGYTINDTVVHNGVTLTANATHTSSAVFVQDFTKWDR